MTTETMRLTYYEPNAEKEGDLENYKQKGEKKGINVEMKE